MGKIEQFFRKNEWVVVGILVLAFLALRLPGVSSPLHQDEYKWPQIANPATALGTDIPHPPLSEFIYRVAGEIVGFDVHFRFVPLFFGVMNLLLLYYFLRQRFDKKTATVGSVIFVLSYFSILASLMVDTDGAIMPFFFLIALISYDKIWQSFGKRKMVWVAVLALSCIMGFFVKVSFALAICALLADFLWQKKNFLTKKDMARYAGFIFGGVVLLWLLLFVSQYFFSFFNLKTSFEYWMHFANIHRNWLQTGIQVFKALLYSSPFLVLVPFLLDKHLVKKVRPFLFYILFGIIFYTILFDFSLGALDRYMQFIIIPLCVLSAVVLVSCFRSREKRDTEYLLLGTFVALVFLFLATLPHSVPSLYPKTAWIGRILSFKWNFLYPFSGGSGPLGFYISFLFMGLSWIFSLVLVVVAIWKPHLRRMALLLLIPLGLVYNGLFAEEYLFGGLYGSAPKLLSGAVGFIKNDPDIKYVTVYNDNGGYEIQQIGKYRKRLYTDPAFDINEKIATLNQYKEIYLEINIPRIDPNSVYRKYLDSCKIIYNQTDHYISAKVYDCSHAPDVHK